MISSAFDAVADPTRRVLMERLRREGQLPLGALADGLPMTRQAVTKHLDALRDAGLVRVERRGRQRLHELDPQPLREVVDFLAPYAAAWDQRLARLSVHLEESP